MSDGLPETEENFAELFAASSKRKRRFVAPGEKVTGKITQLGVERAFLDLGDGLDGMLDLSELAAKGEKSTAKVGDSVEAFVIEFEGGVATLAKSLGKGAAAKRGLEDAASSGVPVEGKVVEVNKGGYVVEIAGTRCFCPLGQMDIRRIEDPATMIGAHLAFRVTESRGRDFVVSRRALLEEEQAGKAKATRDRLAVGARFQGTVTNVRDFGVFVDIGGLEGLVHVSELGYGRVRPQDAVHVGQGVEVEVLKIEAPGPKDRFERLTLSMRSLAADPWDDAVALLSEGLVLRGKVQRVQPFGAFVELVPGVDGLLHVSAFGKRVAHPGEMVKEGDEIAVRVDAIDGSQRRISLTWVDPAEAAIMEGVPAPVAAPAPAVGAAPAEKKQQLPAGGMKVRKGDKVEPEKVERIQGVAGTKPRIIGRQAIPEAVVAAPHPEAPRMAPVRAPLPRVGDVVEALVEKHEAFGAFVTFGQSRGLLPANEVEMPKNGDLRRVLPVGTKVKVAVIDVRPDGKIRVSVKGALEAEERAEAQEWMKGRQPESGKGFGTFADLLKKRS